MGGQGPKAGGLGYAEEIAPTIKAANTVPDVVYAINDKATRNRGSGPTRHDDGAANGFGVQDDGAMYTLDTASRHAVCYPETARCLTARHDGSPCADRGPDVICHSAGFNDATGERAQGSTAPCITGDHGRRVSDYTALCVGNGQMCNITMAEVSNTLECMHDQQAVLTSGKPPRRYIVRRLTPLECCRLQGFPDWWTEGCEEYPITQYQRDTEMLSYVDPHGKIYGSDSAKYKMWGNGMALPNMLHVMVGISRAESRRADT